MIGHYAKKRASLGVVDDASPPVIDVLFRALYDFVNDALIRLNAAFPGLRYYKRRYRRADSRRQSRTMKRADYKPPAAPQPAHTRRHSLEPSTLAVIGDSSRNHRASSSTHSIVHGVERHFAHFEGLDEVYI